MDVRSEFRAAEGMACHGKSNLSANWGEVDFVIRQGKSLALAIQSARHDQRSARRASVTREA
jgi:Holliday junction resolvase-like predicted endonuclease